MPIRRSRRALRTTAALVLALGLASGAGAQLVKKPSELIRLAAGPITPGQTENLKPPVGTSFAVPDKKVLVIRGINVLPIAPGPGVINVILKQGSNGMGSWALPMAVPSHIPYPAGWPISAGPTKNLAILNAGSSDGSINVELNGYLVKAK